MKKMFARKTAYFTSDEARTLMELGFIAEEHVIDNHQRTANALHQALDFLCAALKKSSGERDKAAIKKEFSGLLGMKYDAAIVELHIACLNSGQYGRAIEVMDMAISNSLGVEDDYLEDRAELLVRMGKTEQAEKILREALAQRPDDVWLHIALGDAHYVWQIQDERRDLEKAEQYYYDAYDAGYGDAETEEGLVLLERLGDVCVDRLRASAEKKLLQVLEDLGIGSWRTFSGLRDSVYVGSNQSVMFHHLQAAIGNHAPSLEAANQGLHVLMDAYNLMPQRVLEGQSPFETAASSPHGPETSRIFAEKNRLMAAEIASSEKVGHMDALTSERLTVFQEEFMGGKDPVTGRRRQEVVDQEYRALRKKQERGEWVWMGFLDYRNRSSTEPMQAEMNRRMGRNDSCYCGSGKKFKKCHGA